MQTQDAQGVFLDIEEDHKGRVHCVWTDSIGAKNPEREPRRDDALISLTAFRSNVDGERFFVAVADTTLREGTEDDPRYESTFYVDAHQAAVLAQCFASIAAKLS